MSAPDLIYAMWVVTADVGGGQWGRIVGIFPIERREIAETLAKQLPGGRVHPAAGRPVSYDQDVKVFP